MSALGHYLEQEGLATTGISLIREHTEKMRPPRALWVTFELGRPLGVPDDPDFQRRVLLATLKLLERTDGPLIEAFPDPAPEPADFSGWACPLPGVAAQPAEPEDIGAALVREIAQLEPWYDRAVAAHGRTTVGVLGLPPVETGRFLAGLHDGSVESPVAGVPVGDAFRRGCEDLKAYYLEAASAFPGAGTGRERADWLWNETVLATAFRSLRTVLQKSENAGLATAAVRTLVPAVRE